jgi:hypothetical protein
MTLNFFSSSTRKQVHKERYYISQFDGDTYQIVDSIENREICVCSNYDDWEDAEEQAKKIVALLNASVSE